MMLTMAKRSVLSATLSAALVCSACQSMPSAKLTADAFLLNSEFDAVRARLLGIDWTPAARDAVLENIESLRRDRDAVRRLIAARGSDALVRYVAGESILDSIAASYNTIRLFYLAHLEKRNERPDMFVRRYDESARHVYEELVAFGAREGRLPASVVMEYLSYILRGYVVYRSGGAASLLL